MKRHTNVLIPYVIIRKLTMLNTNENRIPKNDLELNQCVQAMNRAYGKYFNLEVGENRSNKLRDCYCESIGFTNGAYQQLQAYWKANSDYDFSDLNLASAIIFEFYGGYNFVLASPIASQVMNYFCQHFPNNHEGFLSESGMEVKQDLESFFLDNPDADWEEYGWDILCHDSEHQAIVSKEKANGNWFPLYYGTMIIGFAFSKDTQLLINGLLISCFIDKALDFSIKQHAENEEWENYVTHADLSTTGAEGKFLSLRMDSMESSLYLPFDELVLDENKAVVTYAGQTYEIAYKKDGGMFVFQDIEFDFLSAYEFTTDKTLSLHHGDVDLSGNFSFSNHYKEVEYIELFCFERLEYRLVDEDDIDSVNHLEGAAFLIN